MDKNPQTTHTTNDIPTEPTSCITPFGDTNIPVKSNNSEYNVEILLAY